MVNGIFKFEKISTPPASSGGDGSTVKTGQDASATDSSNKTGVELSLKATAATNEFDYEKIDKVVTYTAKDKYAFKSVKTGDNVVWSTTNASEYATKVVLNGKGKKQKEVTIHLPNGTTKVFKRDGKGKPWNEYTGPLPSTGNSGTSKELKPEEYPKEIKLFKADSNDANKTVELATTEYKVKKEGDDHIYEFNSGVNCTLIKHNDKEVWKYDSSKHSGKYPKSLTYNNKDFKIILNFTDLRIVCEKDGDSYKATEDNTKTPVQLDIKQSSGTNEFDYKKDGKTVTFTAKINYGFNVVRCKNLDYHRWVDIWKTDNENEYSKKVVIEGDNKLTIHIGEGDSAPTKVFNKVGYCEWKEVTQDSTKKSGTGGSGGGATQTSPTSGGGTTGTGGSGGGGTPASPTSGGTTGTDGSGGTDQSGGGATQTSPTSGGGTTGTGGSGGGGTPASPTSGGTTGTDGSGGTDQSGGGTTGTDGSGGGGTQQSTPVTQ
ncbi:hypothetical protein MACK_003672 [Theileria orientalis]|uniref:Uncharacterized protein n=1 Tax=Theileria orientalis TaxID=68886 RepID=A0A976SJH8_THEOR|nr:hypothetical protein MACK_003672 [Theileria orientalis]